MGYISHILSPEVSVESLKEMGPSVWVSMQ